MMAKATWEASSWLRCSSLSVGLQDLYHRRMEIAERERRAWRTRDASAGRAGLSDPSRLTNEDAGLEIETAQMRISTSKRGPSVVRCVWLRGVFSAGREVSESTRLRI